MAISIPILSIGATQNSLVAMPDPKFGGMTVALQDIDSGYTTRTASGKIIRDRIVGGANAKRKLYLEWPPLTGTQIKTILQAVAPVFFYAQYWDPYTNAPRVAVFYVGDREAPVYSVWNGVTLWEGLKFNLIER